MPTIRKYDELTGKWKTEATSEALETSIIDVEGHYDSDNVEGALRELGNSKDQIEINKEKVERVESTLEEHIRNHPGGSGGGTMPTIETDWNETATDGDKDFTIPIYYTSPNLGEGTLYVLVNNTEVSIQTINQGNNTVKIPALGGGKKKLSIYVKDRGGLMSNQLTWNIVCGGIKLSVTMNTNIDYTLTDRVLLTYNIDCDLSDEIHTIITVDEIDYDVISNKGYNSYEIRGLDIGIHKIKIYAMADIYVTPIETFNIIIVSKDKLFITSNFNTELQYEKGSPITLDYKVSIASQEYFNINLYVDDFENPVKTLSDKPGLFYWTINSNVSLGEHTLRIEAFNNDRSIYGKLDLPIMIVAPTHESINYVQGGLIASFNAEGRTNSDVDRGYWIDDVSGYIGKLYNCNYGSNGWIDNELVLDGTAYMEIDMTPFRNNVTRGLTIDMVFSVEDIGNPLAKVIDCMSSSAPYPGISINPYKATLTSINHTADVDIGQDEYMQVTFMIDRISKFGKIFINGVVCEPFRLDDTTSGSQIIYEQIAHAEKIYLNSEKGRENFGSCKIKRLYIYERELDDEEVLQNRMADMPIEEQIDEYNKNYDDRYMPCMYIEGDISNMSLTNKKEVRIHYVSPNEDLYGATFDLPYCQMYWQGTSSIAYANKNYNFELYDSNREAVFYTPFRNGIPENLFCIKCNQMESSNAMNTGLATFANDNLYMTPNPAQQKNNKVRQAIEGFPILVYMNGTFIGVYDFNLDRYSYRSYGYNLFDDCLCYEVSANSDTTAGAFVPWSSSSGKTEPNYYATDFECIYPPSRRTVNGQIKDNFEELKNLINFVGNADEDLFKEQFDIYFDRQSVFRYYLFVQVFGMVDSLGKNMKLVTFDKKKWYIQLYDCDTALGLDNTGALTMDVDIEIESGVFNTSDSRLWSKIRLYFANELKQEYINMRNGAFSLENMLKYFYEKQIDKIPVKYYNKSTEFKYLNYGSQYLYACHGNRYFQIKRWLKERLLYCDTLFGFEPTTSNFVTIRCNKLGNIYLNISTYSPMYLTVKWKDEADGSGIQTLKVPRNKSMKFSYNNTNKNDQEVIIYGADHLKSLGDITTCNPTHLLLSNATRLNEVICKNSSKLLTAQVDGCNYLQTINFNGCSNLGSLNSSKSLEIENCSNLKYLDLRSTKITNVNFNKNGGNLVEIYLPKTITSLYLKNQYSLKVIGLTSYSSANPYHTEALSSSSDITSFELINCPLVERLTDRTSSSINTNWGTVYDFNGNSRDSTTIGEYEDKNDFMQMMLFGMGLCNATKIYIENSMLNTRKMSFRFMYRLKELSLKYLPNLDELTIGNTQTGNTWDDISKNMNGSFDFNNINIIECPRLKTFRIHQFDSRQEKWFNSDSDTLDLTRFPGLETFTCNITTQGLETIILPSTIKTFWIRELCSFSTTSHQVRCLKSECILKNIYFKEDHEDGYEGIDFGNRELNELSLRGLPQSSGIIKGVNTKNVYVDPVFNNINLKDTDGYPLVKVEGTIDLSEYNWTNAFWWFANVDFENDDIEFIMPNDWDYLIDTRLTRVRGLFYKCTNEDFTWDFGARFFKLLNDRDDLGQTYKYATFKEQESFEESAVTLENYYNISDYNYGDAPFIGANLKYVNTCNLEGNGIAFGTFRSSKLVKIGTINCRGTYVWWSSEDLFANSTDLEEVGTINMPLATSTISWFRGCTSLRRVGEINCQGKNIQSIYQDCTSLTDYALPDLTYCTNMRQAFYNCDSLISIHLENITELTPLVNMRQAFDNCNNLITITMDGQKLPSTLEDMYATFCNCPRLTNVLPLPIDFDNKCTMDSCCKGSVSLTDEAIYSYFPYNVSSMKSTYQGCNGLINPEIVSDADRTNTEQMFYGCLNLETLRAEINGSYSYGFNSFAEGCQKLTDVYVKFPVSLYFNDDLQTCGQNRQMFAYCRRLVNVEFDMSELESKADFGRMFRQDKYIESIIGFDISKIQMDSYHANNSDYYLTYDTSFEFIRDWIFINGNGEGLKSSYRFYNIELVPLTTLASIIDNLGEVNAETLRFNKVTLDKLTDAQIASAVAKGWTITT